MPHTQIELRTSPHIHSAPSVDEIMRNVVYALLPICAFAVYQFGLSALALIIVVTASCVGTEALFNWLGKCENSLNNYSAVITGLLMALTLPPAFPLWMGAVAGFIGIGLGKSLFGGLGFNVFNPALVGRAFVQAAFPVAITSWTAPFLPDRFSSFAPSTLTWPFTSPPIDALSTATPLALQKFENTPTALWDLFSGMTAGATGEASALLILICGAYLAARRMMNWRIPVAMLLSAFVTALVFYVLDSSKYPDPLFMLFSGGLMLGAVFMASDMVASPLTPKGLWLYGILMGFLTIIIRLFAGLPEGVMYAILLGNAASPLIEAITQPRIYGSQKNPRTGDNA
jgi:Na+-translocating ferredoxin:NAD+ oxidoreductase subunit D